MRKGTYRATGSVSTNSRLFYTILTLDNSVAPGVTDGVLYFACRVMAYSPGATGSYAYEARNAAYAGSGGSAYILSPVAGGAGEVVLYEKGSLGAMWCQFSADEYQIRVQPATTDPMVWYCDLEVFYCED